MSVTAFIRRCIDAGMPLEMALTAAEQFEAAPPVPSKGALRQRRYRERHQASQTVTDDASDDGDGSSLSLPPSPQTPLPPTQTRECVTTHTRGFAEFWSAYPSKVGKRDAEKAYERAFKRIRGPDPPAVILAGVDRAKQSRKWRDGIIPNPATWLNQDRWEDEPAEITKPTPHERPDPLQRKADNFASHFASAERVARRRELERAGG